MKAKDLITFLEKHEDLELLAVDINESRYEVVNVVYEENLNHGNTLELIIRDK